MTSEVYQSYEKLPLQESYISNLQGYHGYNRVVLQVYDDIFEIMLGKKVGGFSKPIQFPRKFLQGQYAENNFKFVKDPMQHRYEAKITGFSGYDKVAVQIYEDVIDVSFRTKSGESWMAPIRFPRSLVRPKQKVESPINIDSYRGDCIAECELCNRMNSEKICDLRLKKVKNNDWCKDFEIHEKIFIRLRPEQIKRFYLDLADRMKNPQNISGKTPMVNMDSFIKELHKMGVDDKDSNGKRVLVASIGDIVVECKDHFIQSQMDYSETKIETFRKLDLIKRIVSDHQEE